MRLRTAIGLVAACGCLAAAGSATAAPLAYVTQGDFEPGDPTPHALAIFDASTGRRVGSVSLPEESFDIAIQPGGRRAYVATMAGVSVVDLDRRTVLKTIAGLGGTIATVPGGERVLVTDEGNDRLQVIDTADNAPATPIAVGKTPRGLAADPQGKHAYTGNIGDSPQTLSIVDLTTGTETSHPSSADLDRPENMAIGPNGGTVYAANFGASAGGTTVTAFSPPSTFEQITVGSSPLGLTTNPSGSRLYVASRDSQEISVVDTETKTALAPIKLTFSPTDIAVAGDGIHAVVSSAQDHEIAFLDLVRRKVTAGPMALAGAGAVAIAPTVTPRPAFSVKPAIAGELTRFDASASKGGPIGGFSWDFGDGHDAAGASPKAAHRYRHPGRHTVTLFASDTCAEDAVFGPIGASFGGKTAFCSGRRTATKTRVITVPKAAVAVVRSETAKVDDDGFAKVKLACIRELPCKGRIVVAWRPRGRKQFVRVDLRAFEKIPPARRGTARFHVADRPLAALRAKGTLTVRVRAVTENPQHRLVKRSRNVKLVLASGGAAVSPR